MQPFIVIVLGGEVWQPCRNCTEGRNMATIVLPQGKYGVKGRNYIMSGKVWQPLS